ncbi:hypothetical protein [Nocardia farcinica]|uniref:hypothetical protein n=1 Tax=Nocardia farcinica TaxID=37329 RepID=UPI0024578D63|nr:hypothetical protein [Nocardia farcinica]
MNLIVIVGIAVFVAAFVGVVVGVIRRAEGPGPQITVAELQARLAEEARSPGHTGEIPQVARTAEDGTPAQEPGRVMDAAAERVDGGSRSETREADTTEAAAVATTPQPDPDPASRRPTASATTPQSAANPAKPMSAMKPSPQNTGGGAAAEPAPRNTGGDAAADPAPQNTGDAAASENGPADDGGARKPAERESAAG